QTDGGPHEPKILKIEALIHSAHMLRLVDCRGDSRFLMKKLVLITSTVVVASLIVATLVKGVGGFPQNRACLRVMPIDELARGSSFIGRVKVVKVEKINYRRPYGH